MPPRSLQRQSSQQGSVTKLPCWPHASRLTIALTRDYSKIVYRYFFERAWMLFALMFLFPVQADGLLRLFGYDDNFISFFPFIRNLYLRLTSVPWIGQIDVGYFHLLDVTLWLSIFIWSSWLIIGLFFLRQYDDFFCRGLSRLADRTRDRGGRVAFYIGSILLFSSAIIVTYASGQDKILRAPEFIFVIKRIPALYFFLVAALYYYTALFWSFTIFTFSWKIFRQKWPGVILWSEEMDSHNRTSK